MTLNSIFFKGLFWTTHDFFEGLFYINFDFFKRLFLKWIIIFNGLSKQKEHIIYNVIKLSTDDHWQSLQKTLKPGMEQSFNQIVIPGLFFWRLFEQFQAWQKYLFKRLYFLPLCFTLLTELISAMPHSMKVSCRTETSHCDCIFFLALSGSGIFLFFSPVPLHLSFHQDTDGYLLLQFWNWPCNAISILLSEQEDCYLQWFCWSWTVSERHRFPDG